MIKKTENGKWLLSSRGETVSQKRNKMTEFDDLQKSMKIILDQLLATRTRTLIHAQLFAVSTGVLQRQYKEWTAYL